MSGSETTKDFYDLLGANEGMSRQDLDRLYKRKAARLHPDRGGSEDEMKSLNEAYGILRDETKRREYDSNRLKSKAAAFRVASVRTSGPAAQDVGVFGHCLSALLCLLVGLFLLFLVRTQWMWFLWPLVILAVIVIVFGVMMARSAMVALNASLPATNPFRRHTYIQEVMFWTAVGGCGYGLYLVLSSVG